MLVGWLRLSWVSGSMSWQQAIFSCSVEIVCTPEPATLIVFRGSKIEYCSSAICRPGRPSHTK